MTDREMAIDWIRSQGWNEENLPSDELLQMEQAFIAGLERGRPQWHDLEKDQNDLPDLPKENEIKLSKPIIGAVKIAENQYMPQDCRYSFSSRVWRTYKEPYGAEVIAWCEMPTFNKE